MSKPEDEEDARHAIGPVLRAAVRKGVLHDSAPIGIFYNMRSFQDECRSLIAAFPENTLHGFALKACPVVPIIRAGRSVGMGGECASIGEIALCLSAGMSASEIIFDSPAKTDAHLLHALRLGVHINADNIEEVERIDRLRMAGAPSTSSVGLRINPQTGAGSIAITSTAAAASKFGVPLLECREQILAVFEMYSFLNCVHVHVGSQGCEIGALVKGAAAATEIAEAVNERVEDRVTMIDIGGGLSVDYEGEGKIEFETYVAMLREAVPGLFKFRIITEFGRRLIAKAGWFAARVQHVKNAGGKRYIVCHAGADLLLRPVYAPEKWKHRIELRGSRGSVKQDDAVGKFDIAGPLCFSGDIIGTERYLPEPDIGDIIVVRDAGAYTLSMYSRHTSQLVPPVYGYEPDEPTVLQLLKKAETIEDLVRFWGGSGGVDEEF